MALIWPTTSKDISAYKRNLPREYVGDFNHKAKYQQRHRARIYLERNMTRALSANNRRLSRQRRNGSIADPTLLRGATVNGVTTVSNSNGNAFANGTPVKGHHGLPLNENANGENGDSVVAEHDTSIPAIDSMSQDALQVKRKSDHYKPGGRRSLRQITLATQASPDSELTVKLCNIRKKLNWKENRPTEDQRPRKRARLDNLKCFAHLTIWAKLPGLRDDAWEPKISKSQECDLIRGSSDYDQVKGRFIEIRPQGVFAVSKDDLRITVQNGATRSLQMAQSYFMEIKIVPEETDADWPPFPILTRAANESSGLEFQARNTLQGSLVASYRNLPESPDPNKPLTMCYLSDNTFDSKYGLQLEAKWGPPSLKPAVAEEVRDDVPIQDWMLDTGSKPFGRIDPTRRQSTHLAKKSTAPLPRKENPPTMIPVEPKVIYSFEPTKAEGPFKRFRNAWIRGFQCQVCPNKKWPTLEQLLLHLERVHHEYKYSVKRDKHEEGSLPSRDVVIVIESREQLKPRLRDKKEMVEDKCFLWQVPNQPLDISRLTLEGDRSWLGEEDIRPKSRQERMKGFLSKDAKTDPQTQLRRNHGGFLPYQNVQPFRPAEHPRKKYPNIRLRTLNQAQSTPYTSISHRALNPEDPEEEARSETDDETDDTWFVAHHLEELDLHAREHQWSSARRSLAKRWDYHILNRERGVTSRYISDSLIRFVRMEKAWILGSSAEAGNQEDVHSTGSERLIALTQMLDELKDKRVIDNTVCADVFTMLYVEDHLAPPKEERLEIETQRTEAEEQQKQINERQKILNDTVGRQTGPTIQEPFQLPADVCLICRNPIQHQNRRAVRCSALDCANPNIFYHAKCAGLELPGNEDSNEQNQDNTLARQRARLVTVFMKVRLTWKCAACVNKQKEAGEEQV